MKIIFESDLLVLPVSKAISILTDRAKVCVEDIHYDGLQRVVEISMQRRELTGFRKSLFGEEQPIYSQKMVKCFMKIWQVEEMKLKVDDRLASDNNSCFTVLFGVKVSDNELYLGSAEEIEGNILCQITFKIKKLYIELSDETESGSREGLPCHSE